MGIQHYPVIGKPFRHVAEKGLQFFLAPFQGVFYCPRFRAFNDLPLVCIADKRKPVLFYDLHQPDSVKPVPRVFKNREHIISADGLSPVTGKGPAPLFIGAGLTREPEAVGAAGNGLVKHRNNGLAGSFLGSVPLLVGNYLKLSLLQVFFKMGHPFFERPLRVIGAERPGSYPQAGLFVFQAGPEVRHKYIKLVPGCLVKLAEMAAPGQVSYQGYA